MRRTKSLIAGMVLIMLFMVASGFSAKKTVNDGGRVLVLGFKSGYLDDVQERIFREMLMRKLSSRGYELVPVMEIESILLEDTSLAIRNIQSGELPVICAGLKAAYALSGSVEVVSPFTTLPGQEQKKMCQCELLVYDAKNNKTESLSCFMPFHEQLDDLFKNLSEKITETVEKSGTVIKK